MSDSHRGSSPVAPSRLTTTDGVDVHVGDLRDAGSVRAALSGVSAVFHISPHEADEVELTTTVVRLCEELGVRVVFAGVHVAARTALSGWVQRQVYGRLLPRYRGKFALARLVERSRTRPVVLVPSNFMQNDEVFGDEIREGWFVHPGQPQGPEPGRPARPRGDRRRHPARSRVPRRDLPRGGPPRPHRSGVCTDVGPGARSPGGVCR